MAKTRGRTAGFIMSNAHRTKIQKSNILRVLIEHAEGRREMNPTAVTAGLGLLKKCLPDLSSIELTGDKDSPLQVMVQKFTGDAE